MRWVNDRRLLQESSRSPQGARADYERCAKALMLELLGQNRDEEQLCHDLKQLSRTYLAKGMQTGLRPLANCCTVYDRWAASTVHQHSPS
jgi:hypothetical protein